MHAHTAADELSARTRWPVHTLTPLWTMFTPLAVLPESGLTTKSVQCAGQRAGTSASVWEQANCCGVLTYVGDVKARRVAGQHLAVKPVGRGWLHPGAPDCMLRGEVYLALFWLRLGVGGVFHRRPHAQRHREGVAHELVVDERLPVAPHSTLVTCGTPAGDVPGWPPRGKLPCAACTRGRYAYPPYLRHRRLRHCMPTCQHRRLPRHA